MKKNTIEQGTEKVQISANEMSLMHEGSKCCLVCDRALTLVNTDKSGAAFIDKTAYDLLGLHDHFKYQRKVSRRIEAGTALAGKSKGLKSTAAAAVSAAASNAATVIAR